jgi:AmmeMemoRadiSam system protein A/AmmeMemoRadiSam system protein B
MGEIQKAYIVPHPPIVIPEVGKGQEKEAAATINAYNIIGREISELAPDVIIITTPHGVAFGDYIHISPGKKLKGSFADFGAPEVRFEFKTDMELVDKIIASAHSHGIESGGLGANENSLDHGVLVPLYYVTRYYSDFSLIRISIADLPPEQLYTFGYSIQKAVAKSDKKVVFISSGDLSHKLKDDGPYGFAEEGPVFDSLIAKAIKDSDFKQLIEMDTDFCNAAGECGLRSFVMMAGALNGYNVKTSILSYEKPFGVGYMIAELSTNGQDLSRDLVSFYECRRKSEIEATRKAEDPYVALARMTIEHYVRTGKILDFPDYLSEEMYKHSAGIFVSIKKHGQLRGCIGTISPVTDNVAEEIIQNAVSAATRDPRFNPVKNFELDDLVYSVDVLGEPEPIKGTEDLNVKRYGVIVKAGYRRGILLPDLNGVDTPLQQVEIALSKAGIYKNEKYSMERFEVIRHR